MRHKISFFTLLLFFALDCYSKELQFDTPHIEVNDIKLKEKRELIFRYTNRTETPIVICNDKTFCGCTKVKYSRKPIYKGCSDSLLVVFKPTGKGAFYKKVIITDSQQSNYTLVIKGVVD